MSPHLPSILQYTLVVANALQEVSSSAQIPFLKSVCTLSLSIIPLIEKIKFQKERCLRLAEEIHCVLCALMALCLHSDNLGLPQMLDQTAKYAETLQRLYVFLRAQNELGKIRRLLKQSEIAAQLESCEADLKAASDIFTAQSGVGVARALFKMDLDTERRHQEILEQISARSSSFTTASSIRESMFSNSSTSFSLLPASPKILHGRDSELNHVVESLLMDSPRVAILGPGGMGKTSLAIAALHHAAIVENYTLRQFISCESANTSVHLASIIGSHLGLEPSRQPSQAIVRHLGNCGPCLIILDNLETPWEPLESRGEVEELLSLLADVPTLALLITMRGAERPANIKWNRPFLPPLEPLEPSATRKIFSEVADEPNLGEEFAFDELLGLSGSLPLVVSLMASIASFEGYTSTLSRWKVENTSLLSDGYDKQSNLEKSIILSLGSPRLSSYPHAKSLLSLLSILPDGITDEDIISSKVPLPSIAHCRSSLIRTSLAYTDVHGRLKALSPIREYMRRAHPPPVSLCRPLRTYFQHLLKIWDSHQSMHSGNLAPKLVSYLGNINDLMLQGLDEDESGQLDIAHGILILNEFSTIMLKGKSLLRKKLPGLIRATGDSRLRWAYAGAYLMGRVFPIVEADADLLITEGTQHFNTTTYDNDEAIEFYLSAAYYYIDRREFSQATQFVDLVLGQKTEDTVLISETLYVRCRIADALRDAHTVLKLVDEARGSWGPPSELEQRWTSMEATAYRYLGDLPHAVELCAKANKLLVAIGMENCLSHLSILDCQADIHLLKSEYTDAHRIQAMVASQTSPTKLPHFHANALASMASLEIAMSNDEAGILKNLNGAKAVYKSLGNKRAILCSLVTAELHLYRGDTSNARSTFEECVSKSYGGYYDILGLSLARLGDMQHRMYSQRDTFHWAVVYFSFSWKAKDRVAIFDALRCLADITSESNDEETALNLYQTALEGATKIDIHRLRAQSMTGIGDIRMRRGDTVQAKEMWEAAYPLFVKSSQGKDVAAIDARLAGLSEGHVNIAHLLAGLQHNSSSRMSVSNTSVEDTEAAETIERLNKMNHPPDLESPPTLEAANSTGLWV
ncbi:hypothetical protein DFH09DRAFT_1282394 [Mycena vulgaris]|nr:hypothetical protein DFH09DRAFT_1282394 [Mycena vulgaris]